MDEFTYNLSGITPKEADFIMTAISNIAAPLSVSGPIYTKMQAQFETQNAAYLASQKESAPVVTKPVKPRSK